NNHRPVLPACGYFIAILTSASLGIALSRTETHSCRLQHPAVLPFYYSSFIVHDAACYFGRLLFKHA
ncbi:MAG: hypothetical protein ACRDDP_10465, partial [Plesiomonas sp.]